MNDFTPTKYGSDGSTIYDRAARYGDLGTSVGNANREIQFYGRDSALSIVLSMIIDDGDSTRERRE